MTGHKAYNRVDMTGDVYGELTVIKYAYFKNNKSHWFCRCSCGNESIVARGSLIRGKTKSCGCKRRELISVAGKARYGNMTNQERTIRKMLVYYVSNAKIRKLEWNLTLSQFSELVTGVCSYCGEKSSELLGIDRVNNDVGYTIPNCVTACYICNRSKGTMSYVEFLSWLRRINKWHVGKA